MIFLSLSTTCASFQKSLTWYLNVDQNLYGKKFTLLYLWLEILDNNVSHQNISYFVCLLACISHMNNGSKISWHFNSQHLISVKELPHSYRWTLCRWIASSCMWLCATSCGLPFWECLTRVGRIYYVKTIFQSASSLG